MGELVWTGAEVPFLTDPSAGEAGVRIAFSSRLGGVSDGSFASLNLSSFVGDDDAKVAENRILLERAAGFEKDSITLLKQVHGTAAVDADGKGCGVIGEGDALLTRGSGHAIGVLAADCVPVLLASGDRLAAVHAGWRGLTTGVIEAAAARTGQVEHAWVGPAIKACCYEVGEEVIAAFQDRGLPVAGPDRVDPQLGAMAVLERLKIPSVAMADICTSCDERFFSHRRDAPTGRQGGFIAWR